MELRAFFFGPDESLFGIEDLPGVAQAKTSGVVICQPLGHEYIRCHRGCRQLASRLAQAGFPTLRFDYAGCGDSLGSSHEFGPQRWLADVRSALEQMRSRVERLVVIGLRLGANLAVEATAGVSDVSSLVLWEPVQRGARFLEQIGIQHAEHETKHGWPSGASRRGLPPGAESELIGFALSGAARKQLSELQLGPPAVGRVLQLLNGEPSELPGPRVGVEVEQLLVPERGFWTADPYEMVIPAESIAAIVEWVSATEVGS